MALALLPGVVRASNFCNRVAEWVLAIVSMGIGAVLSLQAFCRYVLDHALPWPEAMGEVLLVWLTFFGASVAYRRCAHLSLDIFVSRLRHPLEDLAAAISSMAGFGFFIIVTWYGAGLFVAVLSQTIPALGISKGWSYAPIPLCSAVMILHSLALLGNLNHWRETVQACLVPGQAPGVPGSTPEGDA